MSDLEEMGYILQPHTSAGRIPSDKGYRLYVDELMREKEQEVADIKNMVIEKTDRREKVLQQVVKVSLLLPHMHVDYRTGTSQK